MKSYIAIALVVGLISRQSIAQSISPYLVGNNAWMSSAFNRYGEMENLWGRMKDGGFQLIRIGGAGPLSDNKDVAWLLKTIDGVRSAGAEPLVQVPSDFSESQAKDFITAINVTNKKNVRLWSIGNEPDWQIKGGGNNPQGVDLTASGVGIYTRRISQGLRSVDPNITIFAGEFAWWNDEYTNALLGGSADVTGKDKNGNYYIDGISWHHYNSNALGMIEAEVNKVNGLFAKFNSSRPANRQLRWMLGEFNMTVNNNDVLEDQKCWSFHAGQLFAEVYDLGMRKNAFTIAPWSMHEAGGARKAGDLGIFDGTNGTYYGRSSYWHSLMLGQNMKRNYLEHSSNQNDVVVIAMGDTSGTAVMLLNRSTSAAYDFSLRLSSGGVTPKQTLQVVVKAGLDQEITGSIGSYSTQMLVFDAAGVLKKRYTYTSKHADAKVGPTIVNFRPNPVPGMIEAENAQAMSGDLQIEATTDLGGGSNLGYSANGSWAEYPLEVSAPGSYKLLARVATANSGSLEFLIDGQKIGAMDVSTSGGWQSWKTQTVPVELARKGAATLRIQWKGSTNGLVNLNWLNLERDLSGAKSRPQLQRTMHDRGLVFEADQRMVDPRGRTVEGMSGWK